MEKENIPFKKTGKNLNVMQTHMAFKKKTNILKDELSNHNIQKGTFYTAKSHTKCCCSVAKSGRTLCDPTDCSTPGFPVLPCFPKFAQIHVH